MRRDVGRPLLDCGERRVDATLGDCVDDGLVGRAPDRAGALHASGRSGFRASPSSVPSFPSFPSNCLLHTSHFLSVLFASCPDRVTQPRSLALLPRDRGQRVLGGRLRRRNDGGSAVPQVRVESCERGAQLPVGYLAAPSAGACGLRSGDLDGLCVVRFRITVGMDRVRLPGGDPVSPPHAETNGS